jgi:UDP-N-acetylmuramate-alanine ligase
MPGVTLDALAEAIRPSLSGRLHVAPSIDDVVRVVVDLARRGDAVITLGAGSIGTAGPRVLDALRRRAEGQS